MPQSLANVLVHLVFSTKDRVPLIRSDVESELYAYTSKVLDTSCLLYTSDAADE